MHLIGALRSHRSPSEHELPLLESFHAPPLGKWSHPDIKFCVGRVKDILVSPSRLHRDINAPPSPHYHHGGLGKHWSSAPFSMPVLDDITKDLPPLTPSIVMRDKHEWEKTQEVESTPLARPPSQTLLRHPFIQEPVFT
jgi:hypothetical protein